MNAIDALNQYLAALERRLRVFALSRGAAVTASVALAATILLAVAIAKWTMLSPSTLIWARALLFIAIAVVIALAVAAPLLRLNRRRAARSVEIVEPDFEQRLLTFTERHGRGADEPFLELLASETADIAARTEPERVAPRAKIMAFVASAAAGIGVLVWLVLAGPGYLGRGAALLWAGPSRTEAEAMYNIVVTPGDRSVRRRTDQLVTAQLVGFDSKQVRLLARFAGSSKWEEALMQPQPSGSGYAFLFTALPDSVDYYVEARGVRSRTHRLTAVDLPGVKKLTVTYHYPAWTGMKDAVEDPGGDLRAVAGTVAQLRIETDRPLKDGIIVVDDGSKIALSGAGTTFQAEIPIKQDGMYHFASLDHGQTVRLTDDYFIEARPDNPPVVHISRPGRDARVTPIEEVTVALDGEDDYGLQELALHYSVNGGPEQTVNLLKDRGAKQAGGKMTLALENFHLVPGDLVSMYATARDARNVARTDMFFVEARPFEYEYSQSQQSGGGAGGGEDQTRISQRQKEIIAATFNQARADASRAAAESAENSKFLSEVQSKLRDQARSLSERAKRRLLAGVNQEFQTFVHEMDEAVKEMSGASDKLKSASWKDALPPEQRALQHLLRAESVFREIQVAFGRQSGQGQGAARDLDNLFDLELDTEKNQYETGQRASAEQQRQDVDEALQRLEQLARRQQQLAQQQNRPNQSFQQRWEQEQLRREAEQLRRQLEQLARGEQSSQSQSQSASSSQSSGQMSRGSRSGSQAASNQQLERAYQQLARALDDMRQATSSPEERDAASRRAAERLRDAQENLRGLRQQQSSDQLGDLSQRADALARQQRDFAERMKRAYGNSGETADSLLPSLRQRNPNWQQVQQLASEKDRMARDLESLQMDAQRAARDLAGTQPAASSKLRQALGELQEDEVPMRMKITGQWMRRGRGALMAPGEAMAAMALDRFRDRIKEAQSALTEGQKNGGSAAERALARVEQLRNQLDRAAQRARNGAQTGDRQSPSGQQGPGNQQGQANQQGQTNQQGQANQQGQRGQGNRSGNSFGDSYAGDTIGQVGVNRGNLPHRDGPAPDNYGSDQRQALNDAIRELSRMRSELGGNTDLGRDISETVRDLRQVSQYPLAGPQFEERLRREVLPNLEQLELQLRQRVDAETAGQVRNVTADPIPPGYADRVAEYFRRLSKSK
jgi:hypothetical protein